MSSKEWVNREKDRAALEELRELSRRAPPEAEKGT